MKKREKDKVMALLSALADSVVESTQRRIFGAAFVAFLTIAPLGPVQAATQSHAAIEAAAEARVRQQLPTTSNRREVRAQPVDPRLRLSECPTDLAADLPAAFDRGQRITVTVQCRGPRPWKIYVPVTVHEIVPVLVAARALARGALLTKDDLVIEERSLGGMRRGYLRAGDPYTGMRLTRSVSSGQVLTPALIAAEKVVRRGQKITLVAAGRGLSIAAEGIALGDGALGQRIKVRNMSSNKEVEGIVRSEQRVEVLLR